MKRIIVIFLFFVFISTLQNVSSQSLAEIQFEKMDHSFGKIREDGGSAIYEFKFNNTGKTPLVIQGVNASCGCTTPEWSREPILPGKSGFIKVSYNPEQRPGAFTKSITVNANIPKGSSVLTISGEVIPRTLTNEDLFPVDFEKLRLNSGELSFMKIKDNDVITDTIQFYNPGNFPVSVKFKIIPEHIQIKTFPEVIQPKSRGFFLITFDATRKPVYGYITNRIYLAFNKEVKFVNYISVSAIIEEDFSKLSETELADAPKIEYNSRTFDFGVITPGKRPNIFLRL